MRCLFIDFGSISGACRLPVPGQTEEEILGGEIADEVLESAAETGKDKGRNFTLAFCSGLSTCPD
jgi:hypothetical protein